jgi:hypothetical protein
LQVFFNTGAGVKAGAAGRITGAPVVIRQGAAWVQHPWCLPKPFLESNPYSNHSLYDERRKGLMKKDLLSSIRKPSSNPLFG